MYEQMTTISVVEYESLKTTVILLQASIDKLVELVRDSVNSEEAAEELMRAVAPRTVAPIDSKNDTITWEML